MERLMSPNLIAKNLLEEKICDNCQKMKSQSDCLSWWGEAVGWQYSEIPEEKTCDYWEQKKE